METVPMGSTASGAGKPSLRCEWFAGGRRLGLGVLLAFTVKGIFTTVLMVAALLAASLEEGDVPLPHILIWLAVGIGGYAALGRAHRGGADEGHGPTR